MSNKKYCSCDKPFSDCSHAIEMPHGDKWYCELKQIPEKWQIMIDGWINEMLENGLSYDEMIAVFRLAADKLKRLK